MGSNCVVIEYVSAKRVKVKFESGFEKWVTSGNIRSGSVKDTSIPSVYGVGINDSDTKVKKDGKIVPEYKLWTAMLQRCFCEIKSKAYESVTCCSRWLSFNSFIEDVSKMENYEKVISDGWHLDKDLLFKGNKIYSPETCCFVPQEVNCLLLDNKCKRGNYLIGVSFHKGQQKFVSRLGAKGCWLGTFDSEIEAFQAYKKAKELKVKEVADKYKGVISDKVYNVLINYEVDINA